MKTLNVELGDRRYPIHIGSGLLRRPEWLQPCIAGSRVAVVTNETVGPLYLDALLRQLTTDDIFLKRRPSQYPPAWRLLPWPGCIAD